MLCVRNRSQISFFTATELGCQCLTYMNKSVFETDHFSESISALRIGVNDSFTN